MAGFSSGIMGLFMGLVFKCKKFSVKDGLCSKFHVSYLVITGMIGIVLAFIFAAGFFTFKNKTHK